LAAVLKLYPKLYPYLELAVSTSVAFSNAAKVLVSCSAALDNNY